MSALTSFQPTALAAALVRLRTDAHLSQRRLSSYADVSNTLISDLEAGTAPAPHPTTLTKLARGLATSGSGVVDVGRAEAIYRQLMQAAGYISDEPPAPPDDLRARIQAALGPERAHLWETIAERIASYPEREQDTVLRVIAAQVFHGPWGTPHPD